MKPYNLTVPLTPSTTRWLLALAKANGVGPEAMLATMADAIADSAGRRGGSWEAENAFQIMAGSGFPNQLASEQIVALFQRDEAEARGVEARPLEMVVLACQGCGKEVGIQSLDEVPAENQSVRRECSLCREVTDWRAKTITL